MPEDADAAKVNAKLDKGVLEIHIGKREDAKKAKSREIDIE